MKFKIAAPTNDKINLVENLEGSEYFKIFTVECGKITEEVFEQNIYLKTGKTESFADICNCLSGCNYILTINCSEELKNYLNERKKIIINTSEKIISNAVFSFIEELTRKESNICCSP